MPKKTPLEEKDWNIDGYPVNVEYHKSAIIISDEDGNKMWIDKRKDRFQLELHGRFSFGKTKR